MASSLALSITRVAVPATLWGDKQIRKEPWYKDKDIMFYEGKVLESYYCDKSKTNTYKIQLLVTGEVDWLEEDELKRYDFNAMPSAGVLVTKQQDPSSGDDTDDDALFTSMQPPKRSRSSSSTAVGVW